MKANVHGSVSATLLCHVIAAVISRAAEVSRGGRRCVKGFVCTEYSGAFRILAARCVCVAFRALTSCTKAAAAWCACNADRADGQCTASWLCDIILRACLQRAAIDWQSHITEPTGVSCKGGDGGLEAQD